MIAFNDRYLGGSGGAAVKKTWSAFPSSQPTYKCTYNYLEMDKCQKNTRYWELIKCKVLELLGHIFLPGRILQQLSVDLAGGDLNVPHDRASDEAVFHRGLWGRGERTEKRGAVTQGKN